MKMIIRGSLVLIESRAASYQRGFRKFFSPPWASSILAFPNSLELAIHQGGNAIAYSVKVTASVVGLSVTVDSEGLG
ncbi:hypothetical protein [Methylohalobius crimeensis]|uniref:hypothetical protein n=1 Tax=Methylohalobius crimeensis TaxID=244365 RepID=UPI0003B3343D|nr:hypothetical protein [Methylohalobius crimeensis]